MAVAVAANVLFELDRGRHGPLEGGAGQGLGVGATAKLHNLDAAHVLMCQCMAVHPADAGPGASTECAGGLQAGWKAGRPVGPSLLPHLLPHRWGQRSWGSTTPVPACARSHCVARELSGLQADAGGGSLRHHWQIEDVVVIARLSVAWGGWMDAEARLLSPSVAAAVAQCSKGGGRRCGQGLLSALAAHPPLSC